MRRDVPLSAKTTQEERDMLNFMTKKFERSQGYLIGKMIKRGYNEILEKEKPEQKAKRSKPKSYPGNLDEQFELLWCAKGRKGSKQKAQEIYKKMSEGETNEMCEAFTTRLMDDLIKKQHEPGYQARHLTAYLNGSFWEQ